MTKFKVREAETSLDLGGKRWEDAFSHYLPLNQSPCSVKQKTILGMMLRAHITENSVLSAS